MFRTSVLVALLSFGLLAGCGSGADNLNELDQILGGQETNGCEGTSAAYSDLRGRASVTITANAPWEEPHNKCIAVSTGTEVIWVGNFETHPLVGGVSPLTDSDSPITEAAPSGTGDMATTTVTFEATDIIEVEGYFCDVHKATMGGVIAVFP
jgi:hypothetical protein